MNTRLIRSPHLHSPAYLPDLLSKSWVVPGGVRQAICLANRVSTRLRTSLILVAVLLGACAPAETPIISGLPTPTAFEPAAPTSTDFSSIMPTLEAATQVQAPTEAPPATLLPVATSRGPDLEATDPTTVSLASGGLQFVEFFRFT